MKRFSYDSIESRIQLTSIHSRQIDPDRIRTDRTTLRDWPLKQTIMIQNPQHRAALCHMTEYNFSYTKSVLLPCSSPTQTFLRKSRFTYDLKDLIQPFNSTELFQISVCSWKLKKQTQIQKECSNDTNVHINQQWIRRSTWISSTAAYN